MQLVEQGIIDLDEPIVTYLPQFSLEESPVFGAYASYRDITARMLLSHSSGMIRDFLSVLTMTSTPQPDFIDNYLEMLAAFPISAPSTWQVVYSNAAFTVLGILVAELATDYDSLHAGFVSHMDESIFAPLGMTSSSFVVEPGMRYNLAQKYNAGVQHPWYYYNFGPAGGMMSTATDMAVFMYALLTGGGGIVQAETLAQMFQHQPLMEGAIIDREGNMIPGLGFLHAQEFGPGFMGYTHWGHGGTLTHHHSNMVLDLDAGLGVFMTANSVEGIGFVSSVAPTLLQVARLEKTGHHGGVESAPVEVVERSAEELEHYTGLYTLGMPNFVEIVLGENGLEMIGFPGIDGATPLVALSDGSFLLLDTLRVRMVYHADETGSLMMFHFGERGEAILGQRIHPLFFGVPSEFEEWVGTYFPVLPPGSFTNITSISLGISEHDVAYILVDSVHAGATMSPFVLNADGSIDGIVGGDGYFYLDEIRFERQ
jgi:CubicO group peptidase (beta-lactamase class C family)